ncbi:MAG: sigma-54 dependent transcriptional regulator [Desulfohalobiaceae bacterium]|nr:sigma-54 dependent transcriptional regulator [Desulfohalobiaceae bacterium]
MQDQEWTILVVDDERITRKNLQRVLEKEGYRVVSTESGVEALKLVERQEFDLILADLKMKTVDGMRLLKESKSRYPETEVIMITAYATVDTAVEAMKEGAYQYVAKPFKLDEVRKIVREALYKRKITLENQRLRSDLEGREGQSEIVGTSPEIKTVLQEVRQIGPTGSNILITGESGTGKELFARSIHHQSSRSENRFVTFNCGSFTEDLIANELFGHEKDAYTGATTSKKGLLEMADKGTVFLDEIGDMPLSMQVKLLRVIQEQELMRVGGVEPIQVDIRFIAATHRDLKHEVEAGRFRQDLYYRLNVISLALPPLAQRQGDIPVLAHHFLVRKTWEAGKEISEIAPETMELLENYSWPGNVRELENVIERAVALSNRSVIKPEVLPEYLRALTIETYRHMGSSVPTLEEHEIEYIRWVLQKCRGNKTKAAQIMGIDRVSLWRKIKRYGIEV